MPRDLVKAVAGHAACARWSATYPRGACSAERHVSALRHVRTSIRVRHVFVARPARGSPQARRVSRRPPPSTLGPPVGDACTGKVFTSPTQRHPGISVDAKVMSIMNSFIKDIFEKLAGSASAVSSVSRAYRVSPGMAQVLIPGSM